MSRRMRVSPHYQDRHEQRESHNATKSHNNNSSSPVPVMRQQQHQRHHQQQQQQQYHRPPLPAKQSSPTPPQHHHHHHQQQQQQQHYQLQQQQYRQQQQSPRSSPISPSPPPKQGMAMPRQRQSPSSSPKPPESRSSSRSPPAAPESNRSSPTSRMSPSPPPPVGRPAPNQKNEAWRKSGKIFRSNLILMDEEKGGNSFQLSHGCGIDRYYRVAERVMEQFLSTSIGESDELTESYLVGSRLVKFLSVVLPTHPEYFSIDARLAALRHRSQEQLIELLQYMEELSLLIDEMQYNKYILEDLTPEQKTYLDKVQKSTSHEDTEDTNTTTTTMSSSDKENQESEQLDKKVAAAAEAERYTDDEWNEEYRRHVAAVLAAQPPPPPPPPKQPGQVAAMYSKRLEANRATPEPIDDDEFDDDPSWIDLIKEDHHPQREESKESSWDSSSFAARPSRARIDILDNEKSNRQSPTTPVPKLPQPRAAPPRRASPGYSRKLAAFEETPQVFFDKSSTPQSDLKLRIEERWEQAQRRQRTQRQIERAQSRGQYGSYGGESKGDETGLVLHQHAGEELLEQSYNSNRRILEQFRGCIKCLLD